MIVEPYSAVLDYPHEGSAPLLADHHLICKYSSPEDGNFITVTKTLVHIVSKIHSKSEMGETCEFVVESVLPA